MNTLLSAAQFFLIGILFWQLENVEDRVARARIDGWEATMREVVKTSGVQAEATVSLSEAMKRCECKPVGESTGVTGDSGGTGVSGTITVDPGLSYWTEERSTITLPGPDDLVDD